MDSQVLLEADELLVGRLVELYQETGYPVEAFLFVLRALNQPPLPGVQTEHIHASELCWLVHDQAMASFGSNARIHLSDWNIKSTDDVGEIVYALVDKGLITKVEGDSIQDFHRVFDFDSAFRIMRKNQLTNHRKQWRLSTLFIITSIVAVASAGIGRAGIHGGFVALTGSWIFLLGAFCLFNAIFDRSHWVFFLLIGLLWCVVGAGLFLFIVG